MVVVKLFYNSTLVQTLTSKYKVDILKGLTEGNNRSEREVPNQDLANNYRNNNRSS